MLRRAIRDQTAYSKVSVKSQTVLPRVIRERLNVQAGDTLRYRVTKEGVLLDKAPPADDEPFAAFAEWSARPTRRPMPPSERARYAAGDVVVVPFPYADRFAERRRPVLVVSGPALARYRLLWVVMITSADNRACACDVAIGDLPRAGLPAPSVVRPAKITCIEPARVLRRAGRVEDTTTRAVMHQVPRFLSGA